MGSLFRISAALSAFLLILGSASDSQGEGNYQWSRLAGSAGGGGSVDATGTDARFYHPSGVAVDSSGNVYVSDQENHTIRRVTSGGVVTTIAGSSGMSGSVDGTGSAARFDKPAGMALDAAGNLYVADAGNHTIRKITSGGIVTTIVGTAGISSSTDGSGSAARFSYPKGLAVDSAGNLYVADNGNQIIRKVTSGGIVTTIAGSPGNSGSADGPGNDARFNGPSGVAVDSFGNIYVADSFNHAIRKVTSDGTVSTLAGSPGTNGGADGTGSAARFYVPEGLVVDSAGDIYVVEAYNKTIRKVTSAGIVTTFAGSAGIYGTTDGNGIDARFGSLSGAALDPAGNLYVADRGNHGIRKVTSGGVVTTFAGSIGIKGSVDGTGSAARFNGPSGVTVGDDGNIYVADTNNSTIRKVTSGGVVTTLAGSAGNFGSDANGIGSAARFALPRAVASDGAGSIYMVDSANATVRKVTSNGTVMAIAGSSGINASADGTGSDARFFSPRGVAVDTAGNVYVADTLNHTIRKVTSGGVVTTLAGSAGNLGSADGTGTDARFYNPNGVAVDASGNVYVADFGNRTIRKVTSAGVVTTLAGKAGFVGVADGVGSAARFHRVTGLALDGAGNLFVVDEYTGMIRKVTITGLVTTLGRPAPSNTEYIGPYAIAVDSSGNLYVTDLYNHNIILGRPRPELTLDAPQPGQKFTGTQVVMSGRVTDPQAVARVEVVINGGPAQLVTLNGSGSELTWTLSVVPENGMNAVVLTAYDQVGRPFPSIVSTFTFVHLRPQFAGRYNGLLLATNDSPTPIDHHGLVAITTRTTGTFSGKVILRGLTFPIKGSFLNNGSARFGKALTPTFELINKAAPANVSLGVLAVSLDTTPGAERITGTLTQSSVAVAVLDHADRTLYTAKTSPVAPFTNVPTALANPLSDKGKYTAIFLAGPAPNNAVPVNDFPQGDGWAHVRISPTGMVRITGKLADGSAISYGNALSKNNELPVYVRLYARKGFLVGPVMFDSTQPETDASGAGLTWFKPANALDKIYPAGWPDGIGTDLVASKFVINPSASGLNALGIAGVTTPTVNAVLTLADGFLITATSNDISVTPKNKSTVVGATSGLTGAEGLKLAIVPKTGATLGSFIHPGNGKMVPFRGVVFQKTHTASGYFLYFPPKPLNLPAPSGMSGGISVAPAP